MDTKKTGKNLAVFLICLSAIALIGLNIYQHQQIKRYSQDVNHKTSQETSVDVGSTGGEVSGSDKGVQKGDTKRITVAGVEKNTSIDEVDELEYQLEAAEEELDMVHEQLAEDEAKKAEQKKLQKELQKRYRENPSYRNSMKNFFDRQYADLFKKLNLSQEKLEEFKDLMVEENMAQQDIYLEFDDTTNLSKEEREELGQRYQALHEEYESKKEDLLEGDDYEIYQAYTESQMERYNVNSYMATLGSDEKLTETQKEELVEAMHEARKDIVYERIDNDSEDSSNMYSEENMAMMLKNEELRHEAYLNAAGSILSASQLEKFKTYLQQDRDQYKLIMEMSALREGASTKADSSDNESE